MNGRRNTAAVLFAAAFLCAAAALPSRAQWPPWAGEEKPPPVFPAIFLGPDEAAERMENDRWVVADARPPAISARGRPEGAFVLPPDVPLPKSLPRATGIVVVGDAADPSLAAFLFWRLEAAGRESVRVLRGGFGAWREAGLPVEEGSARPPEGDGTEAAAGGAAADAARLAARYGKPDAEVIDCRPDSLWRLGHVPHALPFDFRSLAGPDGTFPPGPEIRETFGKLGPRPSTRIHLDAEFFLYDGGGGREAALGYLLLRAAGIERARVFPGGWAEWAAADSLPAARIVTAEEIARLLEVDRERPPAERLLLIDARHGPDWRAGHIPGSINLPAHYPPDSLEALLRRAAPAIDRSRAFAVFTCYGPGCVRSRNGSTRAARAGFRRVGWHRGGWEEWTGENRPVKHER